MKYICQPSNYSRNQIIRNLIGENEYDNLYFLPCFKKKFFLYNFFKRKFIINDFFISDFDNVVFERKLIKVFSLNSIKHYFVDYINYKFSSFLISDTKAHFEYWESLFGKTKAERFILPVLANKYIYKPNSRKNKHFKVIFFGSLIPLHGIDKILEAFSILQKRKLNIEFQIIGSGQLSSFVRDTIRKSELRIDFYDGILDEVRLAKEINKSSIILGIFGDSKKAKSVVPNKVYQGLASRKCVITMQSPAISEFFNKNEICLCANDANSLSKSIEKLFIDRNLLDDYANKGYEKYQLLYKENKEKFNSFLMSANEKIKLKNQ